jgi:hypothetical protein
MLTIVAQPLELVTVTMIADDEGTVYIDGLKKVLLPMLKVAKFNISPLTSCIAVYVTNIAVTTGLMMQASNGMETDATWKCTAEQQTGYAWTRVNFDDRHWPKAKLLSRNDKGRLLVIRSIKGFSPQTYWISVENSHAPEIYCRKNIKPRRFTP